MLQIESIYENLNHQCTKLLVNINASAFEGSIDCPCLYVYEYNSGGILCLGLKGVWLSVPLFD